MSVYDVFSDIKIVSRTSLECDAGQFKK